MHAPLIAATYIAEVVINSLIVEVLFELGRLHQLMTLQRVRIRLLRLLFVKIFIDDLSEQVFV